MGSRSKQARLPDATTQTVSHTQMIQQYHVGPLPTAEQLGKYESICVGAADRIINMAETQSAHRQKLETIVVESQVKNSRLGLWFGFIIGMTTIISGAWVAVNGLSWIGLCTSLAGLSSLVGVFVYGKKTNQKELTEKNQLM